ncbi:hypothetical protein UlMin_007735 [Ulmus minor]
MLRSICSKLLHINPKASPFSHGYRLSNSFLKPISEISSPTDPDSLTLSYLQKSCGFSKKSAISASTKNSDSVLNLMRAHELAETHIRKMITTRPGLLSADLEGKIRPNLELFRSLGFSGNSLGKLLCRDPRVLDSYAFKNVDLFRDWGFSENQIAVMTMRCPSIYLLSVTNLKPKLELIKSVVFTDKDFWKVLCSRPSVLQRSLENQLVPVVKLLGIALGTKENLQKTMKSCNWLLTSSLERVIEPNISMLISYGIPKPLVSKWILLRPRILVMKTDRLREILDKVLKLGFKPNSLLFALAAHSMASMSKTIWDQKLEAFRSFGLSEDEICAAFKTQPMCMRTSETKIKRLMDFYINQLNLEPSVVSKNSTLVMYSLEKRIIPRCSVLQLLVSTGLVNESVNIARMLRMTEKKFMEEMVMKYKDVLPDVVKAYQGKIDFQGFPSLNVKITV